MKKFLLLLAIGVTAAAYAAPRSLGNAAMRPGQDQRRNQPQSKTANPSGAAGAKSDPGMITGDRNDREKKTGGDFAFNYSSAALALLIEDYQNVTKKTVIPDPDVEKNLTQTITFQSLEGQEFTDQERQLMLEMLLEMRGIHLEPYGEKFIRAIPRDKARKDGVPIVSDDAEVTEGGRVISRFIKLKYISYEEVQKALEGFKSDKGNFLVFERINTILVTDTELNVSRMVEVVKAIDIETPISEQVFVRQIRNASAQEISERLQKIVEESQKELEKNGKGVNNAQNQQNNRPVFNSRFPQRNQPQAQQQQPAATSPQNLLANISDADRGMIRGKVLILADERSNKLIIVTSKTNMDFFDKVIEQLDIETTPDTVVKVYRLKYAEAEEVSDMINDLIGNAPSSKSSSKGNQNQTAKNGQNANMTRNTTTPNKTASNQRSGEAKAGELSKDNTTVLADKRINGLVVMTSKDLVPVVEGIIESMDVKLSQVLIETVIIEVTLGDDLSTGVDWVMRGKNSVTKTVQRTDSAGNLLFYRNTYDDYGNVTGTETTTEDTGNPVMDTITDIVRDDFWNNGNLAQYMLGGGGGTSAGKLSGMMLSATTNAVTPIGSGVNYLLKSDKLNLAAVISAAKSDRRAKYLASPIIMTVDNKEATIDATESRKFFSGYETSNSYSSYMRTPKYDSKDIGIKIKVTPKINPNGTVMLNIEEEYSQLGAGQSILVGEGSQREDIDTALTRKMSADALLENNQTVILTGLTETYNSNQETGVPILKDIPWIGKWLFSSVTQKETRKELLIFMTPYVLNDGEDAQAEAKRRKDTLSDSRPWDDHGWSRSALADPVSKREQLRKLREKWDKQDDDRRSQIAIEKAKVDRVKDLEKLEEEENRMWLEMHESEMSKEDRELFRKALENTSREERKETAEEIRRNKLTEAEEGLNHAEESDRAKVAESEAIKKAADEKTSDEKAAESVPTEVPEDGDVVPASDAEEESGDEEGLEEFTSVRQSQRWYLALRLLLTQQPYFASCLQRCFPLELDRK